MTNSSPEELWSGVDAYLASALHGEDKVLDGALARSEEAGLPPIQVSLNQGKLLHLLARMIGARSILEIGSLGGYSAIWLGRALPDGGRMLSLEVNPAHAEVARRNIEMAGLSDKVEIRVGRAIDSLSLIEKEDGGPFDFFFIDADKTSNADYFAFALKLSRPGSVIVVDNVVRAGAVADPATDDPDALGVRRLNELIASEQGVSATAMQTVGVKGHDGFILALVL
jgi:predicted O-methyltransferase YrrM